MLAKPTRRAFSWIVILSVLLCAGSASAVTFKPFTDVKDFCPTCKKRAATKIKLSTGQEILATVVAENDSFYTLLRFGEVRALPKSAVQSLDWPDGKKPQGLTNQDQIVLKNGHVISGTIIDEREKPGYFKIKGSYNSQTYVVFKEQADEVYKSGKAYTFSK